MILSCKDFYEIWKEETYIAEDNIFTGKWDQLVLTLTKHDEHVRQLVIEQDSRLDNFGKEISCRFETWLDEEEQQIQRNKMLSEAVGKVEPTLADSLLMSDAFSDVIFRSKSFKPHILWWFKVSLDQVDDEYSQDYILPDRLSDLVIDISLYQKAEMRFTWDGMGEGEHKEKVLETSEWL